MLRAVAARTGGAVTGGGEGVLFIGRAQEKTPVFRTRRRYREEGSPYPWIASDTAVINQFYFYCLDEDFGPVLPEVL
jgi:hypothetical protein